MDRLAGRGDVRARRGRRRVHAASPGPGAQTGSAAVRDGFVRAHATRRRVDRTAGALPPARVRRGRCDDARAVHRHARFGSEPGAGGTRGTGDGSGTLPPARDGPGSSGGGHATARRVRPHRRLAVPEEPAPRGGVATDAREGDLRPQGARGLPALPHVRAPRQISIFAPGGQPQDYLRGSARAETQRQPHVRSLVTPVHLGRQPAPRQAPVPARVVPRRGAGEARVRAAGLVQILRVFLRRPSIRRGYHQPGVRRQRGPAVVAAPRAAGARHLRRAGGQRVRHHRAANLPPPVLQQRDDRRRRRSSQDAPRDGHIAPKRE